MNVTSRNASMRSRPGWRLAGLLGTFAAVVAKLDRILTQIDDFGLGARRLEFLHRHSDRLVGNTVITIGTVDYQNLFRAHDLFSRGLRYARGVDSVLMHVKPG